MPRRPFGAKPLRYVRNAPASGSTVMLCAGDPTATHFASMTSVMMSEISLTARSYWRTLMPAAMNASVRTSAMRRVLPYMVANATTALFAGSRRHHCSYASRICAIFERQMRPWDGAIRSSSSSRTAATAFAVCFANGMTMFAKYFLAAAKSTPASTSSSKRSEVAQN